MRPPNKKNTSISSSTFKWPLIISLSMATGLVLGATLFGSRNAEDDLAAGILRIREVLMYVQKDYVDSVDTKGLTRQAIDGMLERLDPHSAYLPMEEQKLAESQLEGDFDGIGIEFVVTKDTIVVVAPLSGGPSEKAGLRPGDRIIEVDDKKLAGAKLTTQDVFEKLRGPKGSNVRLTVKRDNMPALLKFALQRDEIPTHSIDASFMANKEIGYIKISRFTETTDKEFSTALKLLIRQGAVKLLIDVRDNPGGYLDRAINIADELLEDGRLIVYTDGKGARYDSKYFASSKGMFEAKPVAILINEGSASASEILAGALQDNDRGLVVGRRSFGKGLVQLPISLSDGGELRLTISRYYTPSGRSIQKPYSKDNIAAYEDDIEQRYDNGELYHEQTTNADTTPYKTTKGRTVFGGGGIKPDVFVPLDSSKNNIHVNALYNTYILQRIAIAYAERERKALTTQGFANYTSSFVAPATLLANAKSEAGKEKIKITEAQWAKIQPLLQLSFKALVARQAFGDNAYQRLEMEQDDAYQVAISKLGKSK